MSDLLFGFMNTTTKGLNPKGNKCDMRNCEGTYMSTEAMFDKRLSKLMKGKVFKCTNCGDYNIWDNDKFKDTR